MADDGALQHFGRGAAGRTTLQWPATMGTAAQMLGGKKKKKLNRMVRREPADLSDLPVGPLVHPVRFRFDHFSVQFVGLD